MSFDSQAGAGPHTLPARLKWFNAQRGFGFVTPSQGDPVDAFLHVSTLQRAGIDRIGDGAELVCVIDFGGKGASVKEIVEITSLGDQSIDCAGVAAPVSGPGLSPRSSRHDAGGPASALAGTVKWYKPDKGFGFVTPDDGGRDVFVHRSCLERAGLSVIETGQRLAMTVRDAQKGREATDIKPA